MKLVKLISSVIIFASLSFVAVANAAQLSQEIPYYGNEFYRDLGSGTANGDLQYRIKAVLRSYHLKQNGQLDLIVNTCQGQQGTCYAHVAIGYNAARVFLMGYYYLVKSDQGYAVRDVYCDRDRLSSEFHTQAPAPNTVPDNTIINVEHTWPQSRFTGKFNTETQKSDLHHLFPTDSQLNSIRGNNIFGEVTKDALQLKCAVSRFGYGTGGNQAVFEPPVHHRGNVARALFYFSLRYDLNISPSEEQILRKWNKEDPVDEEEMRRNEEIYKVQGNRNPFVDYPELADRISDF
ncbi:MAG: endonuclease I family protein [Pseudobdellovibrionaceae bacterium]